MLDAFLASYPHEARLTADPIEVPHRYRDPRDIESVALIAACLAFGRVDLFKPKLEELVRRLGPHPAKTLRDLDVDRAATVVDGIAYRFDLPADFAVLLLGIGKALREHGSLEALFLRCLDGRELHAALSEFTGAIRDVPLGPVHRRIGKTRGIGHLLPAPLGAGAAKRLCLYLRWMVRGPDEVDFGIWTSVPKSALVIPLDTHIHRMATQLGLTRRKDLSWRTASEITAGLRALDPADPVKYDFALCHFSMSGRCPRVRAVTTCEACALRESCLPGRRLLARR